MLLNVEKYKIFEKLWKPVRKMKMKLQPIFMYHKFTNLVRNRKTTIIATSQHYIITYFIKMCTYVVSELGSPVRTSQYTLRVTCTCAGMDNFCGQTGRQIDRQQDL